jgi:hypothetical protein
MLGIGGKVKFGAENEGKGGTSGVVILGCVIWGKGGRLDEVKLEKPGTVKLGRLILGIGGRIILGIGGRIILGIGGRIKLGIGGRLTLGIGGLLTL